MNQLDVYQAWLDIPPSERPISHYRLLGLRAGESNHEAIQLAAQATSARIAALGHGEFQEASQRLVAEISAAAAILIDPVAKQHYDARLGLAATGPNVTGPNVTGEPPAASATDGLGEQRVGPAPPPVPPGSTLAPSATPAPQTAAIPTPNAVMPGVPAPSAVQTQPLQPPGQLIESPPAPIPVISGVAPTAEPMKAQYPPQAQIPMPPASPMNMAPVPAPAPAPAEPSPVQQSPAEPLQSMATPSVPLPSVPTQPQLATAQPDPARPSPPLPTASPSPNVGELGAGASTRGPIPVTPPVGTTVDPSAKPEAEKSPGWIPPGRGGRVGKAIAAVVEGESPARVRKTSTAKGLRRKRSQQSNIPLLIGMSAVAFFLLIVLLIALASS